MSAEQDRDYWFDVACRLESERDAALEASAHDLQVLEQTRAREAALAAELEQADASLAKMLTDIGELQAEITGLRAALELSAEQSRHDQAKVARAVALLESASGVVVIAEALEALR